MAHNVIGTRVGVPQKSYRRYEFESHQFYYEKREAMIFIVQILKERMDATQHLKFQ